MNIAKFFREVRKLKSIKRSGWIELDVDDPESVADHCFMVLVYSLVLGKDLDTEKLLKMAIVHDLAESQVGDIISKEDYSGGTHTREEKIKLEREGFNDLLKYLEPSMADEFLALWEEFESAETKEAKFLKDIDRMEAILQSMDYFENRNHKKPIEGFWDEKSLSRIKSPELRGFILNNINRK